MTGDEPHPPSTLDERIAATSDGLTSSERDVVAYLSDHREEVAFLSAAEIAAALGISDATVVRTAQTLGYRGLSHLKRDLREAVQQRASPALRYRRSIDALGDDDTLLGDVIATQLDLLTRAARSLPAADVRRAVEVMAEADHIFLVGFGPLASVADYVALSLRRLGRPTTAVTERGAALADDLVQMRKGDTLVVLAYERVVPDVAAALDHAASLSIPCVLVTDHLALALAGRYEVALGAERGALDMVPSVVTPLVILEALVFGVARQDRQRSLAALDGLNRLREQLDVR